MEFTEILLTFLQGKSANYRAIRSALYTPTLPARMRRVDSPSPGSFRTTLHNLKKQGLVEQKKAGVYRLTEKGRQKLIKLKERVRLPGKVLKEPKTKNKKKDVIVIFDIPEKRRAYRDWLRRELIALEFTMVQKSVWIGPTLPEKLLHTCDDNSLAPFIHNFFGESRRHIEIVS